MENPSMSDAVAGRPPRFEPAKLIFLLVFLSFEIFVMAHHEVYRDETVLPLMFPHASFGEMLTAYRGIMFPLYDWTIFTVTYGALGHSLLVARAVTLLTSAAVAWLLLFRFGLPKRVSMPLLCTAYLFYEYGVFVNRDYGWISFLIVLLTYLEITRKPLPLRLLVICLLILDHPLSFTIAGGYLAYLALREGFGALKRPLTLAAFLLVLGCTAVTALEFVSPYAGHIAPFRMPGPAEIFRQEGTLLALTYFPVTPQWWAPCWWPGLSALLFVISAAAGAWVLAVVRVREEDRRAFWAAVVGLALVVAGFSSIFVFRYALSTRHMGLLYLATLSFIWIAHKTIPMTFESSGRLRWFAQKRPWLLSGVWYASCACLIFSAAGVSWADVRHPFTNGERAANYLKERGLDRRLVTVVPDWVSPSIAAHLDRPRFYSGGNHGINDWEIHTQAREAVYLRMSPEQMLADLPEAVLAENPVVIVNRDMGPAIELAGRRYELAASFKGAIVSDENYFVYLSAAHGGKKS